MKRLSPVCESPSQPTDLVRDIAVYDRLKNSRPQFNLGAPVSREILAVVVKKNWRNESFNTVRNVVSLDEFAS